MGQGDTVNSCVLVEAEIIVIYPPPPPIHN